MEQYLSPELREKQEYIHILHRLFEKECSEKMYQICKDVHVYRKDYINGKEIDNFKIGTLKKPLTIKIKPEKKDSYELEITSIGFFVKMFTHKKSSDKNLNSLFYNSGLFNDGKEDEIKKDLIHIKILGCFFDILDSMKGYPYSSKNIPHLKLFSKKPIFIKLYSGEEEVCYKLFLGAIAIKNKKGLIIKSIFVSDFKKIKKEEYENTSSIKLEFDLDSDKYEKEIDNIANQETRRRTIYSTAEYRNTYKKDYRY